MEKHSNVEEMKNKEKQKKSKQIEQDIAKGHKELIKALT